MGRGFVLGVMEMLHEIVVMVAEPYENDEFYGM